MKKLFALVLALLLPVSAAYAVDSISLDGLSFDELVTLKTRINLALWETDEWQEVEVPVGTYEIGVDIPAGHWTISAGEGQWPRIEWGTELSDSGQSIKNAGTTLVYTSLIHPEHGSYEKYRHQYPEIIDLQLMEGTFFIVADGYVTFTLFTGKPDLGFK